MATPAERLAEVNARISALKAKDIEGKRARLAEIDSRISELKGQKTANAPPPEPTFAQEAVDTGLGTGETLLSLLSGAAAEPIAGVSGLVSGAANLATGASKEEALARAASTVEGAREALTYQPRTESAQNLLGAAAKIAAPVERFLDVAGEKVSEYTGSPLLGALTKAGVEIIPLGRTFPKSLKSRSLRNQEVAKIKQEALKQGVDLTAPIEQQKKQIVQAAIRETDGRFAVGSDLPQLQTAVVSAKRSAKEVADVLYEEARARKASLPLKSLEVFVPRAEKALSSYDIADMPKVQRRLAELEGIYKTALENRKRTVDIRQLEMVRRRIISNQPASIDKAQGAALNVLKAQIDTYMDDLFDAGMITGDKKAIQSWKTARSAWADYSKRFNEDKFVKKLTKDKKATPEEIKNWLFGASAAGAKPEAGRTVKALNDALTQKDPVTGRILAEGKDSPQMNSLRKEVLMDVMEPLMFKDTFDSPRAAKANFGQFVVNYNTLIKNNPTLVNELFDKDSLKALNSLSAYASSIAKQDLSMLQQLDMSDAIAKAMFGHELAKGTLRLDLARRAMRYVNNFGDRASRQKAISDISGYDLGAGDWLSIKPVRNQAALQSILAQSEQEEEKKRQEALTKRPPGVQTRGTLAPGQGQPPAQPPAGAGAPPGGAPNSQSRMMLQSLFPQDTTLQMPVPQPPPQPA